MLIKPSGGNGPRDPVEDDAVSSVIAVILMVAVAVVLSAVLYGWSAGMDPGEPIASTRIGVSFGGPAIHLRHQGGAPMGVQITEVVVATAGDVVRHRVDALHGTWSSADPDHWESGELVCVSCAHAGDKLHEISVNVRGHLYVVWQGTHDVRP